MSARRGEGRARKGTYGAVGAGFCAFERDQQFPIARREKNVEVREKRGRRVVAALPLATAMTNRPHPKASKTRLAAVVVLFILPVASIRLLQALAAWPARSFSVVRCFLIGWTKSIYTAALRLMVLTRSPKIVVTGKVDLFVRDRKGRATGVRPLAFSSGQHSSISDRRKDLLIVLFTSVWLANHQVCASACRREESSREGVLSRNAPC